MARPEEKANAMMNKWLKMKEAGNKPDRQQQKKRRPRLASDVDNLADAERFRRQLVREISDKISKIQNPGLGEHTIRDLNDEINKRMREKYHWNVRIKELGGPDFAEMERKQQLEHAASTSGGDDPQALIGSGGYRYFGAAKDLPGVKELFQRKLQKLSKRKRADLWKQITPDYFGWRDEEDGVLLELEQKAQDRAAAALGVKRRNYKRAKQERGEDPTELYSDDERDEEQHRQEGNAEGHGIPSQEMVAQALLEQKKEALLARLSF